MLKLSPGRALAVRIAAVLMIGCVSACGGGGGGSFEDGDALELDGVEIADEELFAAAREEGSVSWYTSLPEGLAELPAAEFTETTGIEVQIFRAASSELLQRALTENDAGVNEFDVIDLTGQAAMNALKDDGVLAEHAPPTPAEDYVIPENIDPDDRYHPLYAFLYIPAYNSEVTDTPVTDWEGILAAEHRGTVGTTAAGIGGSGLAVAAFERDELEDGYWDRLGDADPVVYASTVPVAEALGRGELTSAIAAESVLVTQLQSGAPIEIVYPDEGIVGGTAYVATAEEGPNPNAARVFTNWLSSVPGQTVISENYVGRPILTTAPDVAIEGIDLPALADLNVVFQDEAELLSEQEEIIDGWNSAVGYTD